MPLIRYFLKIVINPRDDNLLSVVDGDGCLSLYSVRTAQLVDEDGLVVLLHDWRTKKERECG